MAKAAGKSGRGHKKAVVLVAAVAVAIAVVAGAYFIAPMNGFGVRLSVDYSAGAEALGSIASSANSNVFENVRLNPFGEVAG